jgi:hypothetical protein
MRTMMKGLFLSALLVVLTGCGISGKWTLQSVTPDTAKGQCPIKALCLNDDGTYVACTQAPGQDKGACGKGTYSYDKGTKVLAFKADDGKEFKYTANLMCPGGEMKITGGEKGKEWTAVMKRGECKDECGEAKKCGSDCKKACGAKGDAKKTDATKPEGKAEEKKPEVKKAEAAKPDGKVEGKPEAKKAEPGKTDAKK